jgi:hypothetical protein
LPPATEAPSAGNVVAAAAATATAADVKQEVDKEEEIEAWGGVPIPQGRLANT